MGLNNHFFDEFRQLNLWIQILLIVGAVLLIVLVIANPAAGVAVTGFLIALKGVFSQGDHTRPNS